MSEPRVPGTRETIAVGPFGIFFCNTNTEMKLKGHCHTAYVTVVYETTGTLGYPSFEVTNTAIRQRLRDITGVDHPFRDATNEDVTRALFRHLDGWEDESWKQWTGQYRLHAVHLDVVGVQDRIGHDPGTTRYTLERSA